MSTGRHRGQRLGACTDCRSFWGKYRAGTHRFGRDRSRRGPAVGDAGTCAVMGTASTMACIAEALGMSLPGTAAIPAVQRRPPGRGGGDREGRRAADRVPAALPPRQVITEPVGRERVPRADGHWRLDQRRRPSDGDRRPPWHPDPAERLNAISDETPGAGRPQARGRRLHGGFHAAGGMGAVLRELRRCCIWTPWTSRAAPWLSGWTSRLGWVDRAVIRPFDDPVSPVGGLIALTRQPRPGRRDLQARRRNPALFETEGRAVVFTGL